MKQVVFYNNGAWNSPNARYAYTNVRHIQRQLGVFDSLLTASDALWEVLYPKEGTKSLKSFTRQNSKLYCIRQEKAYWITVREQRDETSHMQKSKIT